ncbi:NCS2 family permease [Methanoregula sp.]|uniref:NCS2 family permease n=1 Tax=Methanoregula sp. TaxID=2052170 RepID=UPI002375B07C|nr:NCS2 family permease [Methanoregula sp.]MDD1686784.1 NCS2 family permease [Methanoregula sp.]
MIAEQVDRIFRFSEHHTTLRQEVLAGIVTFIAVAYIIIVNPAILKAAGIPYEACMAATILSAAFGCAVMGVYANRPFAIATYVGENAFVAYTVVGVLHYPWQTALGAVFLSGLLLSLLTLSGWRSIMSSAVPASLKYSFAAGIGLFLAFIGFVDSGIVIVGSESAPVAIGDLHHPAVILAIFGFVLTGILLARKIPAAILLGILATAGLAFATGIAPAPAGIISMPPSLAPTFLQLDIAGVFTWGMFSIVLTLFTMAFLDTMGTLIGMSARAGLLDSSGNLPQIERPFLADGLATTAGALLGTTTNGVFVESAAGIEQGGRTGFVAVVCGALFLLALFFAPLFSAIPLIATGPALILVGLMMLEPVTRLDFSDYAEVIPAFTVITMMSFTYNIGVGLCAGFVLWPVFAIVRGRIREIQPACWALFLLCLAFFVFYPY